MTGGDRPLVGVLGGMGPLATADFYTKIVELSPAARDQDHVRIVIWADPTVPDRSSALLDGGPSPVPALVRGVRSLQTAGAQVIAMPCNTAHAFLPELRAVSGVTILDMIELTMEHVTTTCPGLSRLGILATRGTHATRLYQNRAAAAGLEPVLLGGTQQRDLVDRAIAVVKGGRDLDRAASLIRTAVASLRDLGAEAVVVGCTELPVVAGRASDVLPVVDATSVLAQAVVELGTRVLSGRPIPSAAGA
jgi:aspartate racemase